MSESNGMRNLISGIMKLDPSNAFDLIGDISDIYTQQLVLIIFLSLQRSRTNPGFEGWKYKVNPFGLLIEGHSVPLLPPGNIIDVTHELTQLANEFGQLGILRSAEEYYRAALSLCFIANNTIAAVTLGSNLDICYIVGNDTTSALNLANDALPMAIKMENWYTVTRFTTIKRLCHSINNQISEIEMETERMRKIHPPLVKLDHYVFEYGATVLGSPNHRNQLRRWEQCWQECKSRIK